MHVKMRSTPASFILETCTDRSEIPKARDLSWNTTELPVWGPNFWMLFMAPSAQSDDWGTE